MRFTGRIVDETTHEGVPLATVELWVSNVMLARTAADSAGYFDIGSASTPDYVAVSSASYLPAKFLFTDIVDDTLLPLERNVKEGEGVTVTASMKKNSVLWLGAGLLLLLLLDKKR